MPGQAQYRKTNEQIREWAKENGISLKERGMIPKATREQWALAQDVANDRQYQEVPEAQWIVKGRAKAEERAAKRVAMLYAIIDGAIEKVA